MSERQPPFRVMLRMQIKAGMEEEFQRTWISIGDVIARNPANIGQWLVKSAERVGEYYIISDWVGESQFREFEHSAEHVEHRAKLHPYRTGGEMWTSHIVTFLPGAAGVAV